MYLICHYSDSYKAYNLKEVEDFLENWLMIGDLGELRYQLKKYKVWEGNNGILVEGGHLNKDLKNVEFAPNTFPKEQPKQLINPT